MSDKIGIRKQHHLAIVVKSKFIQNEFKRLLKRDPSVLRIDYHWNVILLAFLIDKLRHLRHIMKVIAVFFSPMWPLFQNSGLSWEFNEDMIGTESNLENHQIIFYSFSLQDTTSSGGLCTPNSNQTRMVSQALFCPPTFSIWSSFSNFDNIFESLRIFTALLPHEKVTVLQIYWISGMLSLNKMNCLKGLKCPNKTLSCNDLCVLLLEAFHCLTDQMKLESNGNRKTNCNWSMQGMT